MVLRSVAPVTTGSAVLTGGAVFTVTVAALARLLAAVRVGGGDEQAHRGADVGGGELVAGAGRARDVRRRRALPLVGVGVPVAAPRARRRRSASTARCAVPEIAGATVLTGPAPATVAVGLLAWLALPSGLVAVTSTRMVAPTSAAVERVRRRPSRPRCSPSWCRRRSAATGRRCCCRCRSRCRSCRSSVRPRCAVPVIVGPDGVHGRGAGDRGGRGAGGGGAAVGVGGGDEHAHGRADVGDGQLVAGAGRARDVDPARAVGRALPLVGVAVADAGPGAGRRRQRGTRAARCR